MEFGANLSNPLGTIISNAKLEGQKLQRYIIRVVGKNSFHPKISFDESIKGKTL